MNRPAVMVMPERETPGRERERLREPHHDCVPEPEIAHRTFLR